MSKKIFLCFISVFLSSYLLIGANFVVVIDAGHGGKDGGAVRGRIQEKSINLGVALALGQLIEANMKDVNVVYTRKSDVFVDLYKRSGIANKAKANLFISIHTNSTAAKVTSAAGADTYILGLAKSEENLDVAKRENSVIMLEDNYTARYEGFDPNSPESNILFQFMTNKYMDQSLEFATYVQSGFSNVAKRVNRGVAQAGFLVLRESSMPSVLIELGFINNQIEAQFLASDIGQQKMAQAIYSGFKKYKDNFDKRQGVRVYTEDTRKPISNNTEPIKKTEPKVDNEVNYSDSNSKEIEYKIQFLISSKQYSTNDKVFKGLSPVEYYLDNKTYKYTYGSFSSEKEAIKSLRSLREKFKDAFVIKVENGVRKK